MATYGKVPPCLITPCIARVERRDQRGSERTREREVAHGLPRPIIIAYRPKGPIRLTWQAEGNNRVPCWRSGYHRAWEGLSWEPPPKVCWRVQPWERGRLL